MRMRKKKNLIPRMEKCAEYLVSSPEELKGKWASVFKGAPAELEIGCGKGGFITALAQSRPDTFFIAGEIEENVLMMAMEKAAAAGISNLLFISCDAARLADYFEKGEISRIYLNFSDPWPGARNRKKRLTSHEMLKVYKKILPDGGEIRFKTDNEPLFAFSLATLPAEGFDIYFKTYDLHSEAVENIPTEYETRFTEQGKKIMALYARLTLQDTNEDI